MLVILCVAVIIVLAFVFNEIDKKQKKYCSIWEALSTICIISGAVGIMCLVGGGLCNHYASYTSYLTLQEEYQSLVYKADAFNQGLADDLGLNNNSLLNEIKDYNKQVISLHRNSSSPWLGIFYNSKVKELETIDYSMFNFNLEETVEN